MVYRFRVTLEDHEDVYRDIEIKSSQSFMEFHTAIQQAIGFDNSKSASFYSSDDYWRKEKEIASENTTSEKVKKAKGKASDGSNNESARKKKTIADHIDNPHQKFVYIFDPEKEWTFLIELLKIIPADAKITYPKCIKSIGASPKQYKETNLPPPVPEELDEPKKIQEEEIPLVLEKDPLDEETEDFIPLSVVEGEEELLLEGSEEGEEVKGDAEEPTSEDEEGESSDDFEFDDEENL